MPETSRTISASLAFADRIDRLNAAIGRTVAWACLLVVLVQFAVVVMRYVFGLGSIWLTETIIYGHAALFMLAAAWTLREGGHVRVDVFYADAGPRRRALIDLCGALLLLLPFMLVLLWFAVPYVARSWAILETSRETSGLPGGVSAQDADPAVRAADGVAGHRAGDPRRACAGTRPHCPSISPSRWIAGSSPCRWCSRNLAILMVVAVCGFLFFGYPVALTLGGVSLAFAALGHLTGAMSFSFLGALPQRVFGVMTNEVLLAIPLFIFMGVMLERSRIAEELARNHGPAVRHAARRLGHLGRHRRHAARRRQRRGRRDHGDDGPDRAADHAAPRLRQAARRRHGRRDRDAGADFPARDRAGAARRPALDRLSGRAAPAGQFRAVVGDGERSVRRRAGAGLRAGRAVHPLSDRHGGVLPEDLARDPARARRAEGLCAGAPADRGAGRAAPADPRGAGLDPRRHRDADRSRFGRRGRRDPAGGASRARSARRSARWCSGPRRSPA